jgi:hypothetical protein
MGELMKTSYPPLSLLEVSGALSARVMHDLSNMLSSIMGNAEFAQRPGMDAERLQKALQAISASSHSAAKLLGQCVPLQQLVARAALPVETAEQAAAIEKSVNQAPGWKVTVPSKLSGKITVESRWLTAAVLQVAREANSSMGEIHFSCGPAVFPVTWSGSNPNPGQPVQLFQIKLLCRGEQPLFPLPKELEPAKFALLAASELIQRFKGQIYARPKPPGRQEIIILLPLV